MRYNDPQLTRRLIVAGETELRWVQGQSVSQLRKRWAMSHGAKPRTRPAKRRQARRRPVRFLFFTLALVLLVLLLGFKLWEIGMAILVYVYLGWCLKS